MVVSMSLVGLWRVQSEKRERLETAEARGREMAEIVADLVGPLMSRGQIRDVDALIISFLRGRDIYTLEVLDPSGDGFSVVEKPAPDNLAFRINPRFRSGTRAWRSGPCVSSTFRAKRARDSGPSF